MRESRAVRALGVFVVTGALLTAVVQVAAASVLPLTVQEMAARADAIVIAKVHSNKSRAGKGGNGIERAGIVTDSRLQVSKVLKGDRPKDLDLTQPGGELGDMGLVVSDLPEFSPGERCILFLNADGGVVGGYQGKLEIVDGEVPAMGVSLKDAERRLVGDTAAPVAPEALEAAAPAGVGDLTALGYSPIVQSTETYETAVPSAEEPQVGVAAAASTLFLEEFESAPSGWTVMPPTGAAWGRTTYRAQSGTGSLYCAQTTNPAPGPMPTSVSTVYISSNPVSLAGYNAATFECDVWSSMTLSGSNWFNVAFATSASGPWYMPSTFVQGATGGWTHVSANLASITDYWGAGFKDFTGGPLYMRLTTYHTTGATDEGVYVDNVKVTADNVVTPSVLSVSPSSANAGVGTTITIDGTNFGATQGTGSVRFLHGAYQNGTTVAASIVSWSDTRIVCTVPRFAESGPVTVKADSGASGTWNGFTVGFSAGGPRVTSYPARYYVNSNTADLANEDAVIQAAFPAWNTCGSNFAVSYAGTTASTSNPPSAMNGMHEIYFASSGFTDSGILAWNYYWYSGSTIVDSNIVFNDAYSWADGAASGKFDLQSVALHELGHTVGLDDQYAETTEVMGAMPMNATRRALSASEISGALYVHGAMPDTTPPLAPSVSSSTHPTQTAWYADSSPVVSFVATDASGIGGYSFAIDASATAVPDTTSEGTDTVATFSGLADGEWYVHARAVDTAGNWGPAAHYMVRVDTAAPTVSTDATASYVGTATVNITATDAHSGVAEAEWRIDDGPWQSGTTATLSPVPGSHTFSWRATDVAGNAAPVRSVSYDMCQRIEQTDSRVYYSGGWFTIDSQNLSAGNMLKATVADAGAHISFKGTSLHWVALKSPRYGIARVRLDGGPPVDVSLYDPNPNGSWKQRVWSATGLSDTTHTVSIELTGRKDAAATASEINIDALDVGGDLVSFEQCAEDDDARLGFDASWFTIENSGLSAGSMKKTIGPGAATLVFRGTGFDYFALKSARYGIAEVKVDGVASALVDLYSPTSQWVERVHSVSGLKDATHTVTIAWTGTKNPSATADEVNVDLLGVRGIIQQHRPRFEENNSSMWFGNDWRAVNSLNLSGGSMRKVDDADSPAFISFRGTEIDLIGLKTTRYGVAKVTLDDQPPVMVDLYAPTDQWQSRIWSASGLADTTHTVMVEWTGTKSDASLGTAIGIDGVEIVGRLTPATPTIPVYARIEQTDGRVGYSSGWYNLNSFNVSGGSLLKTDSVGDAVYVSFAGTAFKWLSVRTPSYGIARVTVDGGAPDYVDLYSPTDVWKAKAYSVSGLSDTTHTVKIEWTGARNPASSGTAIAVDAFDVIGTLGQAEVSGPRITRIEETHAAFVYSGSWTSPASTFLSGSTARKTADSSASCAIAFSGTEFTWIGLKTVSYGIAEIRIDGGSPVLVDLYAPADQWKSQVYNVTGLTAGAHTVTIRPTGTKNPAATGTAVLVDAIDILPIQ